MPLQVCSVFMKDRRNAKIRLYSPVYCTSACRCAVRRTLLCCACCGRHAKKCLSNLSLSLATQTILQLQDLSVHADSYAARNPPTTHNCLSSSMVLAWIPSEFRGNLHASCTMIDESAASGWCCRPYAELRAHGCATYWSGLYTRSERHTARSPRHRQTLQSPCSRRYVLCASACHSCLLKHAPHARQPLP